jgi:hypothetical protein
MDEMSPCLKEVLRIQEHFVKIEAMLGIDLQYPSNLGSLSFQQTFQWIADSTDEIVIALMEG